MSRDTHCSTASFVDDGEGSMADEVFGGVLVIAYALHGDRRRALNHHALSTQNS